VLHPFHAEKVEGDEVFPLQLQWLRLVIDELADALLDLDAAGVVLGEPSHILAGDLRHDFLLRSLKAVRADSAHW